MADTNPIIPPAAKARAIAHMNKDHRTDLSHILQHFNKLPSAKAADPTMLDVDLEGLTVRVGGDGNGNESSSSSGEGEGPGTVTHVVAFDPPMKSFGELRSRLVAMTHQARDALGVVSPKGEGEGGDHGDGDGGVNGDGKVVVVREYRPPQGADWIAFFGVAGYYLCYAVIRAGLVEEGGLLWEGLWWFPGGGAVGFRWLVETMVVPVVAIHVAEMGWFDWKRSSRYGVRRWSRVWFLWMGSVFLEGVGAQWRFDGVVRGLKRGAEGKGK